MGKIPFCSYLFIQTFQFNYEGDTDTLELQFNFFGYYIHLRPDFTYSDDSELYGHYMTNREQVFKCTIYKIINR